MIYRLIRSLNRGYPLFMFWIYLAMFGLGFLFIFIFPLVTIILLFVGVFSLLPAVLGQKLLSLTHNLAARRFLRRNICPNCGERDQPPFDANATWRCLNCDAVYTPSGAERDAFQPEPAR